MTQNIDPEEIAKFSQHAHEWWNPEGDLKTLHVLDPLRLKYIQDQTPLAGQSVIDIGCGGGILAESMAKVGAKVCGIDMSENALKTARLHQLSEIKAFPDLRLSYEQITAEEMAEKNPGHFDIV